MCGKIPQKLFANHKVCLYRQCQKPEVITGQLQILIISKDLEFQEKPQILVQNSVYKALSKC